ncbi:receptor-like protein kinase FERONIA [Impatiens glandulifera]|uniref:receptor-like protein kinase FERONIA n=1 Tax=Impatiens glandulifera TaxID=253017 RepID=UPI001FB16D66|nr:receptor-like protein kinase FERONIA [Impatiens glandulifera]
MTPLQSSIIIFFHLFLSIMICTDSSHTPLDNIFLNCGSSGSSTAFSGQQWIGDVDLKSSSLVSRQSTGRLIKASPIDKLLTSTDYVPYSTAQLSMFDFTYTFQVSPGPKFIRLHFYPASFPGGFQRSGALFTVKAGPYTLLNDFSASSTADDLGLKVLTKEFCITIEEPLRILFSPSNSSSSSYAFVNGIEIVSMPTGLYYTPIGDDGAKVVGKNYRFVVGENTAMELVKRLNVGGSSISPIHDPGLFREWSDDTVHLQESGFSQITTTARINYKEMPTFIAPQRVYQTSWSVDPSKQVSLNFTWRLLVDSGFRYLIRLHFCELHYEIMDSRERKFSIVINNQMAESKGELIKWGGEIGVALYKDYVVEMEGNKREGKYDLFVTICSHQNPESDESIDAILKALELFKLSNPDNYNLAGVNPVVSSQHSDHHKSLFIPIVVHDIITIIVVTLLTALTVVVYAISGWREKICKENGSSPQLDVSCRRFSLSELRSATNNFDDKLLIGRGGFGKVYKGSIDVPEKPVAIKRLNPTSGQGATEFLTEIEMLSNFKDTHVVSLIGYCREGHEMILVYEYMIRGTLADHLYKINRKGNHVAVPNLSWEQRLNICLGAARGLNYLHTGAEKSIIHRDVKSTNILLDENWVAKIGDFGLCKTGTTSQSHTHISTTVKGTIGYLDPEYFLTRRLTKKSDVFAFGVVMLEILCGRPALDTTLEGEERSLDRWAKEYLETGTVEKIIDPSLRGHVPRNCLNIFANLAKECLCNHPSGRPTMADIITKLQKALARLYEDDDCQTKEAEEIQLAHDDPDNESCYSSSIAQSTVPSTSNSLLILQNKTQKQRNERIGDETLSLMMQSQLYQKFRKSEIIEDADSFSYNFSI